MFRTILIANRGEIACRVIRTAQRMGIRTVAVFSDADWDAPHVHMADLALPIGPAPARDSYLRIERIIDAARRSGAEAIHPGYGFLSENAEFAEACAAAGIVFIGPPASAIRAMGSKSAAKTLMEQAGVPLVPGYHGEDQNPALLAREASRIGFPVLIKASAGGGGKGMRVVEDAGGFAEGLALAQGEARASFGDDRVLVERYLTRPRHIEVQVFADSHRNLVYLFERDCSIQRRHQKVVEEAPAPGMTAERRAAMGEAAVEAARAIGYQGAGTVEFIAEGDGFYFMEMNTRLQVEHPVTEMITGQDLVEWQLRVANGETLPLRQDQLRIDGHAIEVRLYAEDPSRNYMPSIGTLHHLRPPADNAHVRVDTGVRQGDAITIHYDPMIAKLIVWDHDRPAAVRRLQAALRDYEVAGVQTNLDLLRRVAAHPAFAAADLDTGFLDRDPALLAPEAANTPTTALAAAAATVLAGWTASADGQDPHSPWNSATAWRLNGVGYQNLALRTPDGTDHALRMSPRADGSFDLETDGNSSSVARYGDAVVLDGDRVRVPVVRHGATVYAVVDGVTWPLELVDPLAPPATASAGGDHLIAPMPGRIVSVDVAPGATVSRGQVLLVLEAMKVQMRLTAPRDGTVAMVYAEAGTLVDDGAELVRFEPA
ncbi:MAG: acetyl/propionyl/methylcrotonyl-CoA carboxylase subunit alpha [Janthinobacterium lividum]